MSDRFFEWPSKTQHVVAWHQADEITDPDQLPDWYEGDSDEWGNIRYLGNASWAHVKQDDQEIWSRELRSHPEFIVSVSDDGDGCVTHFYILIPHGVLHDHWTFKDEIESLDGLLQSEEYDSSRFGSSSDDWIDDPDRRQRMEDAAEHGADGSTHAEHMQDWRECLGVFHREGRITEQTNNAITAQIDDCEKWHIDQGSIDNQVG